MKAGLSRIWLPALALALSGCLGGAEPKPNLTLYKNDLTQYRYGGQYDLGINTQISRALGYLRQRAAQAQKSGEQIAVVLDIDETSLSNWPLLQKDQFANNPEDFDRWVRTGLSDPIRPTLELFNEARDLNVPVFFISGRRESLRKATVLDLDNAGYRHWAELHLRPLTDGNPSVVPFKSGVRANIEARGYKIVVNVGDQLSDLKGGHAERTYKLPNPFYYIE